MSISQAGVYSLKLYENKDFTFEYDTNGLISLSSISNTGDTLELETNDNFIKYANKLVPAENNTTLNDHTLAFQINGLDQSNLDIIEKLQSSIYGWIALITFMDNQVYLINIPFHPKYDKFDSQVSHTWFEELKPRIFTTHRLQGVEPIDSSVNGLVDWDGIDDVVTITPIPDVTGNKTIDFRLYLKNQAFVSEPILYINIGGGDYFALRIFDNVDHGEVLEIWVSGNVLNHGMYDISNLKGLKLECQLIKTTSLIISFTVNGVLQTKLSSTTGATAVFPAATIGKLSASFGTGFYFWDFNINSTNQYEGQPAGNLNTAWVDTIGGSNGVVSGSPTTIDLP